MESNQSTAVDISDTKPENTDKPNKMEFLGTEKIKKLFFKFSLPCVASLLISCLYNIVDQIFVGHGVGYLGNAATGIIFPITVIGWALSLLFGDGVAAHMSVSQGKADTSKIHRAVGNAIMMSFLSGCVLILICYLWGDDLFRLIGATDATVGLSHDYGFIIYAMIPLALAQNTIAAIIRADGKPAFAMLAMAVGAILNIIGDPIAIFVLDMGIKGAAYATIIGQFVSFLLCAGYLFKSKTFKLRLSSFKPDFKQLSRIMALGSSSFLTQIFIVVITIVNNVLLVKYGAMSIYGADIPLAAFVVIMKLFQIVLNIAIGIAAGVQPVVGYNYGAKNYDRVLQLLKWIVVSTLIITAVCTVLFEAIPLAFIKLFGAQDALYAEFAVKCLRIYLSLIIFTCMQKGCSIFLQSIGCVKLALPLSMLRDLLLILFSCTIPLSLGVEGIFVAAPIADVIAMLITAGAMIYQVVFIRKQAKEKSLI